MNIFRALFTLLIFTALVVFAVFGPPRFWGNFTGMTEAEVRAELGEPFRDSRPPEAEPEDSYTLGWYQGFEQGLFLEFEGGVVVSQERVSR